MSVILFYSPFNRRSRDVESLMLRFQAEGHKVISLTQTEGVDINAFLRSSGIEAHSFVVPERGSLFYYIRHLIYFISFCKKNKVSVVFSHLDTPSFIAAIGQYFISARVYLCRHHIDEAELYNYHKSWSYRITYLLAKKIIVVSKRSMEYVVNVEKVPQAKLMHINLAYDFSLYKSPETKAVEAIRKKYGNSLLLVTICRLTRYKRPDLAIKTLERLREQGCDASLVILGDGEMREELTQYISANGLAGHCFLPGHVKNVMDYMAAADFLIHPSLLESSCVAIKEAGLIEKPVIVCHGIGDFDEYLTHGHNAFLVDKDRFVEQAAGIISENFEKSDLLTTIGKNLHDDVVGLFDIKNVFSQYSFV